MEEEGTGARRLNETTNNNCLLECGAGKRQIAFEKTYAMYLDRLVLSNVEIRCFFLKSKIFSNSFGISFDCAEVQLREKELIGCSCPA
jgi:hypothetical protein